MFSISQQDCAEKSEVPAGVECMCFLHMDGHVVVEVRIGKKWISRLQS